MKKFLFIAVIFIITVLTPSLLICRGISSGESLVEVEKKIEIMKKENLFLEKKLARLSSCLEIYNQAIEKGYLEASVTDSESETVALIR